MKLHSLHERNGSWPLVEVLVAVVILSIGVLGAVGMQPASLQSTKEVRNQAVAIALIKELAEKMRSNHTIATSAANPYLLDATIPPATTFSLPTLDCATAPAPPPRWRPGTSSSGRCVSGMHCPRRACASAWTTCLLRARGLPSGIAPMQAPSRC